jgi:hypothetical protein
VTTINLAFVRCKMGSESADAPASQKVFPALRTAKSEPRYRKLGLVGCVGSASTNFCPSNFGTEMDILRKGEYVWPDGNVTRFTLPEDVGLDDIQGVAVQAH